MILSKCLILWPNLRYTYFLKTCIQFILNALVHMRKLKLNSSELAQNLNGDHLETVGTISTVYQVKQNLVDLGAPHSIMVSKPILQINYC